MTQDIDPMTQNSHVNVNWLQFNVPTILSVGAAFAAIMLYVGKIKEDQASSALLIAQISATIVKNQVQLSELTTIPFRVTALERSSIETNKRMDRFADIMAGNFEAIRKDLGVLGTKVEVQSNKIDELSIKVDELRQARPTAFRKN